MRLQDAILAVAQQPGSTRARAQRGPYRPGDTADGAQGCQDLVCTLFSGQMEHSHYAGSCIDESIFHTRNFIWN